jgi:hypothetical protein
VGARLATARRKTLTPRLGFIGASPVRRENPVYRLLDFLGFPWILSSESRLINVLRSINRPKVFLKPFVCGGGADWAAAHDLGMRRGRIAHGASLPCFPISSNKLSSEPFPFSRLNPEGFLEPDFYWALPSLPGRLDPEPDGEERTHADYRGVNLTDFSIIADGTIFHRLGSSAVFPLEERMAKARSASSDPRFYGLPVEDQQPLTLLRRLAVEIEDSIAQSRAVNLSARDAIELLERLEGRQFSS